MTRVTALPARATNIAWSIWRRTVWIRIATLTPKRNVTVTAIKVSGDTSMDLASTQSVQLKADVTTDPAGKRPSVTWTSSDTSVATVDSKGKVSGLKAGTVKITATAGTNKKSDSITITITGVKPEVSNVIYATKPSGWSKIYAYVYNDTTSKNNGN